MKKLILTLALLTSINARAEWSIHLDLVKLGEAFLEMTADLNSNLEALHQLQKEELPVQEQWDLMCEVAQSLNKGVEAFNTVLAKYKVNQKVCAPLTTALSWEAAMVKNCQNFYGKPVPENAKILVRQFGFSIIQAKMQMLSCYPELANVILTGK